MILQRFATAVKKQDWMIVLIEFLLVVFGVLIALEVDRYNEEQNDRAEEVRLLKVVQQEMQQDLLDIKTITTSLNEVYEYSQQAINIMNTTGCLVDCWTNLVSLFHSTQWFSVTMNSNAYEEISRLGLPKNSALKDTLRSYYEMNNNRIMVGGELPEYRKLIRSLIPPDIQRTMWANCFETRGRHQTLINDCPSTITPERAKEVVTLIQNTENVKTTLTFWMSNLSILILTLPGQSMGADDTIVALEEEINR